MYIVHTVHDVPNIPVVNLIPIIRLWYSTEHLYTIKGAKLLTSSSSAVEWYKSCPLTSFLLEVIHTNSYMCQLFVNEV